jgi:hypothetical protein
MISKNSRSWPQLERQLNWFQHHQIDRFNFAALSRKPDDTTGAMLYQSLERSSSEVLDAARRMWALNNRGYEILLRPSRTVDGRPAKWPYVFFDDVPIEIIKKLTKSCFVIRTSQNRHHIWFATDRWLDEHERYLFQQAHYHILKADEGSISGEHFGRALSFKNVKRSFDWIHFERVCDGPLLPVIDMRPHEIGSGRQSQDQTQVTTAISPQDSAPQKQGACGLGFVSYRSPSNRYASESGGNDESARIFGYVAGTLERAYRNGNSATYHSIRSNLIDELTPQVLQRGKHGKTYMSAQSWVLRTVNAAERKLNIMV